MHTSPKILLSSFALLLYSFCNNSPGEKIISEKKIKKITCYNINGYVDYTKEADVTRSSTNLYLVQQYDSAGNLVRENGFDRDGKEDNVVEYKYDQNNKLIEKINYKNFYQEPGKRTYSENYLYRGNLLIETRYHYGTGDSTGFFAKSQVSYNERGQKIKDEYHAYNDDGVNETRTFNWKDNRTYIEKRINANSNVERHFVRLDVNGNELEHKFNLDSQASDETGPFPFGFTTTYDEYGNEVKKTSQFEARPLEETIYEYRYENGYWNYRTCKVSGNVQFTQIRKIEYY